MNNNHSTTRMNVVWFLGLLKFHINKHPNSFKPKVSQLSCKPLLFDTLCSRSLILRNETVTFCINQRTFNALSIAENVSFSKETNTFAFDLQKVNDVLISLQITSSNASFCYSHEISLQTAQIAIATLN